MVEFTGDANWFWAFISGEFFLFSIESLYLLKVNSDFLFLFYLVSIVSVFLGIYSFI